MFKLIAFVLGLALGVAGGMKYAVMYPKDAEEKVLRAELEATRRIKEQLDAIANRRAKTQPPAMGFASGLSDPKTLLDPEVAKVRDEQDAKVKDLEARLAKLK